MPNAHRKEIRTERMTTKTIFGIGKLLLQEFNLKLHNRKMTALQTVVIAFPA